MDEQNAITKHEYATLVNYGARDEIRELGERLVLTMPGGAKYTQQEALTLAQIAIAHDLDPFNGEVWLIKDEKEGKVYGALVGIKGHRKHAKRQANYWGEFVRVIEVEKYDAPQGSIVYEYKIYDDVTLASHAKMLDLYIKMGMSLHDAITTIGRPPHTLGIGVFTPGERTKMKPNQCAMFRAEKDALKRRFDVKFRIEVNGQALNVLPAGNEEEGETHIEEIEAEYENIVDEPRDQSEVVEETGTEVYEPTSGEETSLADLLVKENLSENIHAAAALIKKLSLDGKDKEEAIRLARGYRGWRDMGATPDQATAAIKKGEYPK